jgi:hypothetical protein
MHIIFGKDKLNGVDSKYTVLELDTIKVDSVQDPLTAYCLVENIPITEIQEICQNKDLHANLLKNYRLQNWKYCEDALEHLVGKWNGEIDSFYLDLRDRIKSLKTTTLPENWTGTIHKMS